MKRKFDAKLRKVGNSYVITIPKDTIDRFELSVGDFLTINLDLSEVKKLQKEDKKDDEQTIR